MSSKRLHVVMPDELVARIDAALGVGQSRGDWIRRAAETKLAVQPVEAEIERSVGPDVENVRSSTQAKRGTGPRPKGK